MKVISRFIVISAALLLLSQPLVGAAAGIRKSVSPMEGGGYLVKIRVTASASNIYALRLADPKASILDVYAPKGWCIVADGGEFLARTGSKPIKPNETIEFIIHSSTDEINYSWAVFGRIKQIGEPGTL